MFLIVWISSGPKWDPWGSSIPSNISNPDQANSSHIVNCYKKNGPKWDPWGTPTKSFISDNSLTNNDWNNKREWTALNWSSWWLTKSRDTSVKYSYMYIQKIINSTLPF